MRFLRRLLSKVVTFIHWRRRRHTLQKRLHLPIEVNSATFLKTTNFTVWIFFSYDCMHLPSYINCTYENVTLIFCHQRVFTYQVTATRTSRCIDGLKHFVFVKHWGVVQTSVAIPIWTTTNKISACAVHTACSAKLCVLKYSAFTFCEIVMSCIHWKCITYNK